ncbi:MAG: Uma2 family endonuclease, partial [Polyangiales bacterium]
MSRKVPESRRHLRLRMHVFSVIHRGFRDQAIVGSDQFVYWNARDPRRCLSPDVFVFLGKPDAPFTSWKTWQDGGPPHLAVEIVSDSDSSEPAWEEKLER